MKRTSLALALSFSLLPGAASAAEGDMYDFSWLDPDKEVYVLQNRRFRKQSRPYVSGSWGKTTSGAFVDATNIQARAGFFFMEDWGIEGLWSTNSGEENEAFKAVRATSSFPFRRIVQGYYGLMLVWAPFYSKINTFNKIFYKDWLFGVGYGTVDEKNNMKAFQQDDPGVPDVLEKHTGLLIQGALKIYLSPTWDARVNLATLHYSANRPTNRDGGLKKVWNHHYDLSFGVGMTF